MGYPRNVTIELTGASRRRVSNRWFGERRHLRNALAKLETAAARQVEANELDAALRLIQLVVAEVCTCTRQRDWISGNERLDALCLSIGREIRGVADRRCPMPEGGRCRCVYVVPELYRGGGRTRILWRFDCCATASRSPKYLELGRERRCHCPSGSSSCQRSCSLRVLRGKPVERLRAAFAFLTEFLS